MSPTLFPGGVGPVLGGGVLVGKGKEFYIDPVNGNNGYSGETPGTAVASIERYHDDLAVAGRGDIGYLLSTGQAAGSYRPTAAITWSKDQTHLVGICAPLRFSQRARIAPTSTAGIDTLLTMSADGCIFKDMQLFHGDDNAADQTLLDLTGERNYFENVHFAGMGHATGAARAGSTVITLTDGSECVFKGCTIGLDTITRDAANTVVSVLGTVRTIFEDCLWPTYAGSSGAGHTWIKGAASAHDRFIYLLGHNVFTNATRSGATAMTTAFDWTGGGSPAGGIFLGPLTAMFGATDWAGGVNADAIVAMAAPSAGAGGIAVATS